MAEHFAIKRAKAELERKRQMFPSAKKSWKCWFAHNWATVWEDYVNPAEFTRVVICRRPGCDAMSWEEEHMGGDWMG